MSSWATMLPGFAALATRLTGLATPQAHMPTKAIDPRLKGRLEYRVIACKAVSEVSDELRYAWNGSDFIMSSAGMRVITIQVKFTGYDNGPGQDALYYLERLGNRLVWPSSLAALHALDMGLIARMSFLDLSRVASAEDRQWSIGAKDFTFNVVINDTPGADDNPAGWIQEVDFYSQYLDESTDPQVAGTVTRP